MVEAGEDRKLRQFRHTRQEKEPYRPRIDLQFLVEVMKSRAHLVERRQVVEELRHRLVVFVDEDDDLLRRRLRGRSLEKVVELSRYVPFAPVCDVGFCAKSLHELSQLLSEQFIRLPDDLRHREAVDGRGCLPSLPRKRVYGEPLEEFAASLEHRLERGEHERLPETARTRDEELLVDIAAHLVEERRLVDVLALLARNEPLEVEYPRCGNFYRSRVVHGDIIA